MIDGSVDKCSLVSHKSKDNNFKTEGGADNESASESDSSFEEQPSKSVFQNRKSALVNDSSSVPSSAENRISVAKHDSEVCRNWQVTDKGNNTGIELLRRKRNFTSKNFHLSVRQICLLLRSHRRCLRLTPGKKTRRRVRDVAHREIIRVLDSR